jgi:hypothetical protein
MIGFGPLFKPVERAGHELMVVMAMMNWAGLCYIASL